MLIDFNHRFFQTPQIIRELVPMNDFLEALQHHEKNHLPISL